MFVLIAGLVVLLSPAATRADTTSIVSVRLSTPLATLEAYANATLPEVLDAGETRETCIEAQRACTKIPEFRGFKIYSRMECGDVTPSVSCTISRTVRREGPLAISGSGNALTFRQTVRGTVQVRGRGEIGSRISEMANGAAHFTITAKPGLNADWSVALPPLAVTFDWTERPNVMLFDVIRVTFGDEAEQALRREIDTFNRETLPKEVAKIDLRQDVAAVWSELQKPQRIALPGGNALYLHVRPEAVSLEGPTVSDGNLEAEISITGRLKATTEAASPFEGGPTILPNLSPPVGNGTFSVALPVAVSLDTLEAVLRSTLPQTFEVEGRSITVHDATLTEDAGRLRAALEVAIDRGPLRTATFAGRPVLEGDVVRLADPTVGVDGFDPVAVLIRLAAKTGPVRRYIEERLSLDLGAPRADLEAALTATLNGELAPGLTMSGTADVAVDSLELDDGLRLEARATGHLRIDGLGLVP
jgi:hypothetical protein